MTPARAAVAASAVVVAAALIASADAAPRGGTFRIAWPAFGAGPFPEADPTIPYSSNYALQLLDATCAQLVRRRDAEPPAGYRAVPEAAARYPTVSRDGKTYTFTIREGFRFFDGSRLTARNFAYAFNRLLDPAQKSPGAIFAQEIVGAADVQAGAAKTASGIEASGTRLVIRLTKPVPDLLARLTMPFFCPVPLDLPIDPEGVGAPFSGAGPYYVASWERRLRLVALRNPFYRGRRPQHVDRIVVDRVETDDAVGRVERGEADFAPIGTNAPPDVRARLIARYGVNRSQYFVKRAAIVSWLALNTERPLFKDVHLRQAVNFALDRRAILRAQGPRAGNATDQYLPPTIPGFRNAQIYPLKGPKLTKAKELARGHLGSRKAVLYVEDRMPDLATAAIVQANLRQIGLTVELKPFPPNVFGTRVSTRGEPFDLALTGWAADYWDPASFFVPLDGRTIRDRDNWDVSYFDSPTFNRLLDRANRLPADDRYRALGQLDIRVARDEAPYAALWHANNHIFVSKRVGCLLFNGYGGLNLGAVCLGRR